MKMGTIAWSGRHERHPDLRKNRSDVADASRKHYVKKCLT